MSRTQNNSVLTVLSPKVFLYLDNLCTKCSGDSIYHILKNQNDSIYSFGAREERTASLMSSVSTYGLVESLP